MSKVSFITRTKNRPALLRRAIESVLNQTYSDWNMAIVNNGGDPQTVDKLVAEYKQEFAGRLTLIHNPVNLCMEAASNAGISATESDYVLVHDDDDTLAPEFLSIMVPLIEDCRVRFPNVKGILSRTNYVKESVSNEMIFIEDVIPFNTYIKPGILGIGQFFNTNHFPPISFMYCRSVFNEIGMYDENLRIMGDWEFNLRFLEKYDIYVTPYYLSFYHHRVAQSGQYSNAISSTVLDVHCYHNVIKNAAIRERFNSVKAQLSAAKSSIG